MIALLGSLLGFLGAALPDVMRIMQDKRDKAHELAVFEMQSRLAEQAHSAKLEEIGANADIAEAKAIYKTYSTNIVWVDALNGTVRPVLAYAFFLLYAYVKFQQSMHTPWLLWGDDDKAIFAGIISFYYGQRAMNKFRGSNAAK